MSAVDAARPSILSRLQRGLERLYRIETNLDVEAFVVDERARGEALAEAEGAPRRPREQLLVSEREGELALGLFLDATALSNLERHDPAAGLSDANFADFCLAVEGVSHFLYVAVCAARDRPVTALELELQAEIDKFASCVLLSEAHPSEDLRSRLYDRIQYADDLDEHERARYVTANDAARRYAAALERRYLRRGRVGEMLPELRRFYRLGLEEKLGEIARAAH